MYNMNRYVIVKDKWFDTSETKDRTIIYGFLVFIAFEHLVIE